MKKIIKMAMLILLIAFIIIQFFRPEKNNSGINTHDISTLYPVPTEVKDIMQVACNDCHTNKTTYPWYANIQPVAWWLGNHVEEGKSELNFNNFSTYRLYKQYRKLEEIKVEVEEDEMPLTSYTIIHRNAQLTDAQKTILISWSKGIRQQMENTWPEDSLVNPKKRKS